MIEGSLVKGVVRNKNYDMIAKGPIGRIFCDQKYFDLLPVDSSQKSKNGFLENFHNTPRIKYHGIFKSSREFFVIDPFGGQRFLHFLQRKPDFSIWNIWTFISDIVSILKENNDKFSYDCILINHVGNIVQGSVLELPDQYLQDKERISDNNVHYVVSWITSQALSLSSHYTYEYINRDLKEFSKNSYSYKTDLVGHLSNYLNSQEANFYATSIKSIIIKLLDNEITLSDYYDFCQILKVKYNSLQHSRKVISEKIQVQSIVQDIDQEISTQKIYQATCPNCTTINFTNNKEAYICDVCDFDSFLFFEQICDVCDSLLKGEECLSCMKEEQACQTHDSLLKEEQVCTVCGYLLQDEECALCLQNQRNLESIKEGVDKHVSSIDKLLGQGGFTLVKRVRILAKNLRSIQKKYDELYANLDTLRNSPVSSEQLDELGNELENGSPQKIREKIAELKSRPEYNSTKEIDKERKQAESLVVQTIKFLTGKKISKDRQFQRWCLSLFSFMFLVIFIFLFYWVQEVKDQNNKKKEKKIEIKITPTKN